MSPKSGCIRKAPLYVNHDTWDLDFGLVHCGSIIISMVALECNTLDSQACSKLDLHLFHRSEA